MPTCCSRSRTCCSRRAWPIPASRLHELVDGVETVRELSGAFAPEVVSPVCGIDADTIRRIARELAAAQRAAVYGRIGTCTQEFGSLASWLVDVLNLLTGNLDRPGGAMFPMAAAGHANAAGAPGRGRGFTAGRWGSRVRGLDEVFGELPAACLAEEIQTPGEGQVRALITVSGNPAVSTPNSGRLDAALAELDFMISVDVYINETTRHADVILPAPSPLRRSHYDLALYQFAVRNVANYSPPVLDPDPAIPAEWVTLLRLAGVVAGLGPDCDIAMLDEQTARALLARELGTPQSPLFGRDPDELLAALEPCVGPERLLDVMLRAGPYGDGFGARDAGPMLSLAKLEAAPHGIDLGPLQPRLPDALRTPSGKIELAPERLVADVQRLRESLHAPRNGGLQLIGRRLLRSNNSWMHNLPMLVAGKPGCTLHVHPDDAAAARARRRRARAGQLANRRARRAGRGDRRGDARRGQPPSRLGARRRRDLAARRLGPTRSQQQHRRRRAAARRALGQRRPERDSGRARPRPGSAGRLGTGCWSAGRLGTGCWSRNGRMLAVSRPPT